MKKIIKKSLISFGAILPIALNSYGITSCSHKTIPVHQSWTDFSNLCTMDSAKNIVAGSGIKDWKSAKSWELTLGKFDINPSKKIISISIANSLDSLKANFTIKYNNIKYNNNQWKYNGDLTNEFHKNISFPSGLMIDNITKIDGTIYVGTGNGIWSSTDQGKTFTHNKSFADWSGSYITKITKIDGTIYAVTDNGLWTSNDQGKTFIKNSNLANQNIIQITKIDGTIYVKTYQNHLWISNDNGKTFSVNQDLKDSSITQIVKIGDKIYVGTYSGLLISNDHGKTFSQNKYFSWAFIKKIIKINDTIYVGTGGRGLWTSNDYGKSFIQSPNFVNHNITIMQIIKIDNAIYVQGLVLNNKNDNFDSCLWTSNDNGKTFIKNMSLLFNTNYFISIKTKIDGTIYFTYWNGDVKTGSLYISNDTKTFFKNTFFTNRLITQITKIDGTIYVISWSSESVREIYQN